MLPFLIDLALLVVFLIIGIYVLVFLLKAAIYFLPAIILALGAWFLTSSLTLAGIAFLVVALLCVVSSLRKMSKST